MYFQVKAHTAVCSQHFKPEDYTSNGYTKLPRLNRNVIPSVFKCWEGVPHIHKTVTERQKNKFQLRVNKGTCSDDVTCDREDQMKDGMNDEINDGLNDEMNDEINGVMFDDSDLHLPPTPVTMQRQSVHDTLLHVQTKLKVLELQQQMSDLKLEILGMDEKVVSMEKQLTENRFSIDNLSDKDIVFYTGFSTRRTFNALLKFLNPGVNGENMILKSSDSSGLVVETGVKRGRRRKLSPQDQFLLFLCRLRVGLLEYDLATRFRVSVSTVSIIINTWLSFVFMRIGCVRTWPTRAKVRAKMPPSFKEKYPSTRVIIDATEIKCEMPSSLVLKSKTYSNYKSANTLKGLVCITPGGSVSFLSPLYTGSISDKEITERSGFLKLPFSEGDSIMADKGFVNIRPLLPPGVSLNIPPFLGMAGQMVHNDVIETQHIAAERIHVERAIRKIKEFHIFDQIIPLSLSGSINQIWAVCGKLTLFQNPIISQT
jgi:hypothetical protein